MKLSEILKNVEYTCVQGTVDTEVKGIELDSRKVKEGYAFICIKGAKSDGHSFAADVVKAGAGVLFVEDEVDVPESVTVIRVKDTKEAMAWIMINWYGNPAAKMKIIGITGTKGKTTTTHMLKAILEEEGYKVGMIGTLGAFIGSEKYPTVNTTPGAFELHGLFDVMQKAGCQYVVMEVSSQAIKLNRVLGIEFAYGAFLNISPDHISPTEHASMEEYFECKKRLFLHTGPVVVNRDEPKWEEAVEYASQGVTTVSHTAEADFMASQIHNIWEKGKVGVDFELTGKRNMSVRVNMPGEFNVENALVAIAVADLAGVKDSSIVAGLGKAYVKGRTQLLEGPSSFTTMLIDYAHNAVSTENLLSMLKSYHPGRLIVLFGGGGNRAVARRYDMGEAAGKYADLSVLTMDNPRDEEVEDINKTIIEGLAVHGGKYITIIDREEAIRYLLDHAQKDDIIALIGKGHEEYQEIKGKKYHFSEEEVVNKYCREKGLI